MDHQQLTEAYDSFCETSRHLTKEKNGLKSGNKPLDTSVGLVNIIREYFLFKSRINEFLRLCPQSPIVLKLIDTDDNLVRLDIILKSFRENLSKFDKIPAENPKKRKLENELDEFEISQTNTSTPETVNPSKRTRKSLTTPFLTLSANKEIKIKTVDKAIVNKSELRYQSSDDTSGKEDDGEEDQVERSTSSVPQVLKLKSNPEVKSKIMQRFSQLIYFVSF